MEAMSLCVFFLSFQRLLEWKPRKTVKMKWNTHENHCGKRIDLKFCVMQIRFSIENFCWYYLSLRRRYSSEFGPRHLKPLYISNRARDLKSLDGKPFSMQFLLNIEISWRIPQSKFRSVTWPSLCQVNWFKKNCDSNASFFQFKKEWILSKFFPIRTPTCTT